MPPRECHNFWFSYLAGLDETSTYGFMDISIRGEPCGTINFKVFTGEAARASRNFIGYLEGLVNVQPPCSVVGYKYSNFTEGSTGNYILGGDIGVNPGGTYLRKKRHTGDEEAVPTGSPASTRTNASAGSRPVRTARGLLLVFRSLEGLRHDSKFLITLTDIHWQYDATDIIGEVIDGWDVLGAMDAALAGGTAPQIRIEDCGLHYPTEQINYEDATAYGLGPNADADADAAPYEQGTNVSDRVSL